MRRKIFFDLDGTLIDSSQRMHTLFCRLNTKCTMSYDEYWNIKRQGLSQQQVLMNYYHYTVEACKTFHAHWMNGIENEDLLSLDRPFKDVAIILEKLSNTNDLFVVTARQTNDKTIRQITDLQLINFFKDIFITKQKVKKDEIIKNNINLINTYDIIIGDTKEDIETGIGLGIRKFGITTGMLNHDKLLSYNPDKVYNNLKEFYIDIC